MLNRIKATIPVVQQTVTVQLTEEMCKNKASEGYHCFLGLHSDESIARLLSQPVKGAKILQMISKIPNVVSINDSGRDYLAVSKGKGPREDQEFQKKLENGDIKFNLFIKVQRFIMMKWID